MLSQVSTWHLQNREFSLGRSLSCGLWLVLSNDVLAFLFNSLREGAAEGEPGQFREAPDSG